MHIARQLEPRLCLAAAARRAEAPSFQDGMHAWPCFLGSIIASICLIYRDPSLPRPPLLAADFAMSSASREAGPPAKRAKLGSERAVPMPSGANLIEVDGKSCTHEVAWPPGGPENRQASLFRLTALPKCGPTRPGASAAAAAAATGAAGATCTPAQSAGRPAGLWLALSLDRLEGTLEAA